MSDEILELEEEEYTSQLTAPVLRRIIGLLKPHWKWVLGFMLTIAFTSASDAYFTYLNKQFIDQGITLKDYARIMQLATIYGGLIIIQAGTVFTFIYLFAKICVRFAVVTSALQNVTMLKNLILQRF